MATAAINRVPFEALIAAAAFKTGIAKMIPAIDGVLRQTALRITRALLACRARVAVAAIDRILRDAAIVAASAALSS